MTRRLCRPQLGGNEQSQSLAIAVKIHGYRTGGEPTQRRHRRFCSCRTTDEGERIEKDIRFFFLEEYRADRGELMTCGMANVSDVMGFGGLVDQRMDDTDR